MTTRRRGAADDRRRRKMITVLWTSLLAIGTIVLIYKEMTALLYILATVGVTALLVVVAISDLAHAETVSGDSRRQDSPTSGASTFGNNRS